MVEEVELAARAASATGLVVRSSLNAVTFYERLGYAVVGSTPTSVTGGGTIGSTLMRKP